MFLENPNKCLKNPARLNYDEACIDIINQWNSTIQIKGQYTECHKCNLQNFAVLEPNQNTSLLIKTIYPIEFYYNVSVQNANKTCQVTKIAYEHYRYGWNLTETCDPIYIKEPADNSLLPILIAFVVLSCFGTFWYGVKGIYKHSSKLRRYLKFTSEIEEDLGDASSPALIIEKSPPLRKHPGRIKSVDVFRGLCIVVMIFVNYGGGQYWFFKHSVWNGLTIADLVFPWFLWLMGFSLSVSLQKRLRSGVPRRLLIIQIIRRAIILVGLGIMINSNHNLQTIAQLRYPGVLQRFGITYFIVGILEVWFTPRLQQEVFSMFDDIKVAWRQYLFVLNLVVLHIGITFFLDVPGCGKGYLGPGGLDNYGKYSNCTAGAAGYIDRNVFHEHMYKESIPLYETYQYYDPEGILGCLTSVLMVYMGVQAGRILNTYQDIRQKVYRWLIWGFILVLMGAALCGFKKDDGLIPLNKRLWSLSFVLLLSGLAFIIETFLFILIDIHRKWGGRPLFYPGMNSIFLYIGHEIFKNTFPFGWKPRDCTHGAYLLMNLWGTFLWVAISIYMYKRNIFFSI